MAFTVLLVLVGLRALALLFIGLLVIRPVRECPSCFRDTIPVRKPWLRLAGSWLEWRWCPSCRWEGPARKLPGRGLSRTGTPFT